MRETFSGTVVSIGSLVQVVLGLPESRMVLNEKIRNGRSFARRLVELIVITGVSYCLQMR